ncbi:MAG: hypothetical protein ACKVK6_00870, partial [bacterium]
MSPLKSFAYQRQYQREYQREYQRDYQRELHRELARELAKTERKKPMARQGKQKTEKAQVQRIEGGPGNENRAKALEMALSSIEKQFGKGSIVSMSDNAVDHQIPYFSSGSPSIDIALGIGGYPRGRVVEIYGPESSGKTTLTLHAIAEVQKTGGIAAFIDAEHALDVNYARRLGVKVEDLLVSQPDTGEQALEIADVLLRS